jgi:hypothetical protein
MYSDFNFISVFLFNIKKVNFSKNKSKNTPKKGKDVLSLFYQIITLKKSNTMTEFVKITAIDKDAYNPDNAPDRVIIVNKEWIIMVEEIMSGKYKGLTQILVSHGGHGKESFYVKKIQKFQPSW